MKHHVNNVASACFYYIRWLLCLLGRPCMKQGHLMPRNPSSVWQYWRQRVDKRLGEPPRCMQPGTFSGQKQARKTSKRTSWRSTASVYAEVEHCWGLLGVSSSVEREFLSVLSIYDSILRAFVVYCFLLGTSYCAMYFALRFHVCQCWRRVSVNE